MLVVASSQNLGVPPIYLEENKAYFGRELCQQVASSDILRSTTMKEYLLDILEDDEIPEAAFTNACRLLLAVDAIDHPPICLISSPELTINFKYRGSTIIVSKTDVELFNHSTRETTILSPSNAFNALCSFYGWD